jgi:hypothetical protein
MNSHLPCIIDEAKGEKYVSGWTLRWELEKASKVTTLKA